MTSAIFFLVQRNKNKTRILIEIEMVIFKQKSPVEISMKYKFRWRITLFFHLQHSACESPTSAKLQN